MSGKYEKHSQVKRKKSVRKASVLVALLLVLVVGVGATVAYLKTQTNTATNSFLPGHVEIVVNEDYTITVTNNSNVAGYIRATVLVNWMNDAGVVYALAPSVSITAGSGWSMHSDGYYYYEAPVNPGASTAALIANIATTANELAIPSEYAIKVEILAEVIQAKGGAGHTAADWGKSPAN